MTLRAFIDRIQKWQSFVALSLIYLLGITPVFIIRKIMTVNKKKQQSMWQVCKQSQDLEKMY